MLHGAGEDAGTTRRLGAPLPEQPLHGQVVRLGATAGEDDLAGPGPDRQCEGLPRLLHHPPGSPPGGVQRRRVADDLEPGAHRLDGLREHRRRRRMVEVRPALRHGPASLRAADQPFRATISRVRTGSTWCRSPTTPKSTSSKIGASGSLLTATIVLEVCIPARCWIAPEMPAATYSCGETVLPVWPIW